MKRKKEIPGKIRKKEMKKASKKEKGKKKMAVYQP